MSSFKKLQCNLLNQLFNCYCCSFYGCQSWSLSNSCIHKLSTAYNKGLRKIWRLPHMSKTCIVLTLADKLAINELLEKRFCTLFFAMIRSDNPHISHIAKLAERDRTSIIGNNIDVICRNHSLFDRNLEKWFKSINEVHETVDDEYVVLANVIKELCLCRDNVYELPDFSYDELQIIIDHLSTNGM